MDIFRGAGLGIALIRIGLVTLAVAIIASFVGNPEGPKTCAPSPSTPVRFPGCHLDAHMPFVVEINRNAFFAAERGALTTTRDRLEKATAAASASGAEKDARTVQNVAAEYRALPKTASLVLFVDGAAAPARIAVDVESDEVPDWTRLSFTLVPATDAGSDEGRAWRRLLAGSTGFGSRGVTVGVGMAGAEAPRAATLYDGVTLTVFRPRIVLAAGTGLLLVVLGLAIRSWRTGLLRDGEGDTCFSLARVQAAWWMVLTIGGFVFVVLATSQYAGVITASTLGLIGISGSTLLIARGIDQMPDAPAPRPSDGFFRDLMTDDNGDPALQRIQMVAWTVILGLVFVVLTLRDLAFPDFDPNVLILSGLVSATYAGFKVPENKVSEKKE